VETLTSTTLLELKLPFIKVLGMKMSFADGLKTANLSLLQDTRQPKRRLSALIKFFLERDQIKFNPSMPKSVENSPRRCFSKDKNNLS
jgi:hypothetical protein